jgi:hypothetical protein
MKEQGGARVVGLQPAAVGRRPSSAVGHKAVGRFGPNSAADHAVQLQWCAIERSGQRDRCWTETIRDHDDLKGSAGEARQTTTHTPEDK